MPEPTDSDIDQDFASALRRAGVTLEPDRVPALRESFIRYLEMVRVLDDKLAYTDEPAVAMHLRPTPTGGAAS